MPEIPAGDELAALIELLPDGVLVHVDGRVRYANGAAARLFGAASVGELIGLDAVDLAHPAFRALVRERIYGVVGRRESSGPAEIELLRLDGATVAAEVIGTPIEFEGRPGVLAVFRDVTQRRRSAGALQRALQALGVSEARFRSIVEGMPVVFVARDEQGLISVWNREAERVTGYSREEMVGNTDAYALMYPDPAYRDAVLREREEMKELGDFRDREFTLTRKDGEKRTLSWSSRARTIPLTGLSSWSVAVDVTDRIALEAQYRQAQKMEAVGQLAGGVAHDFNNLLTAILSNAELAAADLPAGTPARHELDEIARAARRAAALTHKLLTFSRKQMQSARPLDLNAVVRDSAPLLTRVLDERTMLELELAPGLAPVRADPDQLELVLMNLVVNARDAMPEGGTVTIETAPLLVEPDVRPGSGGLAPGEYVRLTVRDTGVGIAPANVPHIFEPFFTTKPVGQGTGLGLAMVYGVVTQSGGAVRVESAPGRGTTFTLTFPCTTEPTAPMPERRPAVPGGSETILLVEDEAAVRASARRALERHGYTVVEARDGAEALALWRERGAAVQLVITDLRMPAMGGVELAAALRAERPSLPVIFMSGYAAGGPGEPLPPDTESTVIEKPFALEELLARVRGVLDARA
ncbi:MAG TPA: PAS domain S-box protein [Gemmatimonadales bacterium]|nr:PAS domain S-box protein [Gemmatimonadales bacterium]